MIYIIRTKGSTPPLMKIGFSKYSCYERIRKLQTGCPFKLELIQVRQGGEEEEKKLHKFLEDYRFRNEWFHITPHTMSVLGLSEDPAPIRLKALKDLDQKSAHHFYMTGEHIPVGEFNDRHRLNFYKKKSPN